MRIIGYTRISSNKPEQLHALKQHQARLWAAGCTEVYYDIAPRSRHDREKLNFVLGLIEQRQCDEVVFIRVDRITDSPTVLEKAIKVCLAADIPVRGLDDNIDFSTVGGRLHARILCDLARAEVERLKERVMNGHQNHRDRNAAWFAPFGYKKVGDALELDHLPFVCLLNGQQELSKAAIARELIEIFFEHRTLRKTLQVFNSRYGLYRFNIPGVRKPRGGLGFNASGLSSWLNNPILRGHLCYGRSRHQNESQGQDWDIRYHTHPEQRLMSDEEYSQIADLLKWNSAHGAAWKAKEPHPLTGLIYCGECLGSCSCQHYRSRRDPSKKTYSYQCQNYREGACVQKRMVREDVIEPMLIEALIARSATVAQLAELSPGQIDPPQLQQLKAELAYYQAAPGNRSASIVSDLQRQIEAFHHQQSAISAAQSSSRELLLATFGDRDYWLTLLDDEKLQIYRALVDRVTVKDGAVQSVALKV